MTAKRKGRVATGTWVISAGTVTAFAINVDQSITILAIPSIGDALGATLSQIQWMVSGFLLPLAALLVVGGMISDRFGAGRTLVAGLLIVLAGTIGSAMASAALPLIVMRVVTGVGAALAMPASVAAVRAHLSGPRLNVGLAMWFTGALAGSAVGPVLGGVLLALGPWQLVFWTSASIAGVGVVSAWIAARRGGTRAGGGPIAALPGLAGGLGLGVLVWGLINAGERGWDATRVILPIVVGVAVIGVGAAYLRWAGRTRERSGEVDPRLLVGALGLMTASVFGVVGAVFFTIIAMQSVMGYSPLVAGLALLPFAGLAAVLSPLAPRMIDRFGMRRVLVAAVGAEIVGLAGLSRIGVDSGYLSVGPYLALFGVAMSLVPTISLSLALSATPERRAGVTSGAHAASLQFGQLIAIAVVGSLVALGVGSAYRSAITDLGEGLEVSESVVQQIARGAFDDPDGEAPTGPREHEPAARRAFVEGMRQGLTAALGVTIAAFAALSLVLRGRLGTRPPTRAGPPGRSEDSEPAEGASDS